MFENTMGIGSKSTPMATRILVDLNIVLDVLHERQPFVHLSRPVWTAVDTRQVSGAIAAHSVATLFY
jgi:hypothetical protein